ncbi:MAG: antitoxin Xre/MbcA/ParS toxin-binding domain-containing protein [Sphingomonas sp.]
MSTEPDPAVPADDKPKVNRFRRRFDSVRLSPDAAARQGRAATLAWETFGNRERMIEFLNTHDAALGGRPIDLAVASAEGLHAVEQLLAARR